MDTPPSSSVDGRTPERFRLRSVEDLVALVLTTMGFRPTESVVLLCLGPGGAPFQARCDLPPEGDAQPPDPLVVEEIVDQLVAAAVRNRARIAFVVAWSGRELLSRRLARPLVAALRARGVEVAHRVRVHDGRWFELQGSTRGRRGAGVPFDIGTHPLVVRKVLAGERLLSDRGELEASVQPAPAAVEAVLEALAELGPLPEVPARDVVALAEAEWLLRRIDRDPADWSWSDVARLLRALTLPDLGSVTMVGLDRDGAAARLRLWQKVVPSSPADLVAPAAAALALTAWVAGDGALAWCGVERALAAQPGEPLATRVATMLQQAVPPSEWRPLRAADVPLLQDWPAADGD